MSEYTDWQEKVNKFNDYCRENKKYFGEPEWLEEEGTINVIVVRNNAEISFNDAIRNNDKLLIFENRPNDCYLRYVYDVTADPCRKKPGIAHLCEGAYESYVVRPHRWILGRTALCQDAGEVRVARTDTYGVVQYYEWGYFGVNVHDTGGFFNSSLACVILANDKLYVTEYKPLLLRVKEFYKKMGKNFSLFVINKETLEIISN